MVAASWVPPPVHVPPWPWPGGVVPEVVQFTFVLVRCPEPS